jgi:UDP-N-acetyl-D-glucosamine dehydrogenase
MNICVVGQGYVGLPLSIRAAEVGFKVFAFDIDDNKITKLREGITELFDVSKTQIMELQQNDKLNFISKLTKDLEISIFILAVPTPLDSQKRPDLTMLTNACAMISEVIRPETLVINESTSYIGTLRNLIKPLIDQKSGLREIYYAVAPERIDPGNRDWSLKNTPRLISGLTEKSIKITLDFYNKICEQVLHYAKPEIVEAAKLIENTFRQVNIALVNELTPISFELDFSLHDAIEGAATKPFGYMPFYPGIGVGGHCIPVDPVYLSYSANILGFETKLIDFANEINRSMPKKIVSIIESKLKKSVSNQRIQVAGISYKTGTSDIRESPALELMYELKERGAIVSWHDPLVQKIGEDFSTPLNADIELGLIVTPHSQINFGTWINSNVTVLNLSSQSFNCWPKFF